MRPWWPPWPGASAAALISVWHRLGGGRAAEDRVAGAGDAVLVRAADDLRHLREVEDRRRRADLPLEAHRVPRVVARGRAVLPRPDEVVDEDERGRAEREGGDRDELVQAG